ncbi:signal peptidase II [Microlunatus soli]|uniref:Lipoprotein signal peptidase n=1 Tax=Microlunatus soli TaxID=630515 RepID=A0A1H1PEJ8_9ACTN|nr:signal peptidase II [Microlunatus soli]SDS09564.1 signal peptidase II Aspartic peptidase. MEROPS family A08 [Microlunatus soli]
MQTARGTSITESTPSSSRRRAPSRWLFAAVALVGLALDFSTKQLAVAHLDPADPPSLLGGLITLQLIRNSGAAFSLGENYTIVFTVLAMAALLFVLLVLLRRIAHLGWAVALGLLTAGVAGNLTDRIFRPPSPFHGHVVDFVQLPHFAIFNVADMCVTGAAALILILAIFKNVSLGGVRYPTRAEREASETAVAGATVVEGTTSPADLDDQRQAGKDSAAEDGTDLDSSR